MKSARPWGVTVLTILTVISGVLGVLAGLALLIISALFRGLGRSYLGSYLGIAGWVLAIVVLLLSGVTLYFARAIWNLKPWAWTMLIISSAFGIVFSLIGRMLGGSVAGVLGGVAINAIVLYYLFRPEVRGAFR